MGSRNGIFTWIRRVAGKIKKKEGVFGKRLVDVRKERHMRSHLKRGKRREMEQSCGKAGGERRRMRDVLVQGGKTQRSKRGQVFSVIRTCRKLTCRT